MYNAIGAISILVIAIVMVIALITSTWLGKAFLVLLGLALIKRVATR